MPLFLLDEGLWFPPADQARDDGVLAIGGDLRVERLLLAYRSGIFPWYSRGEPLLWWSPDPRFVLFPARLHVSASMRRILRHSGLRVTFDADFGAVIRGCRTARRPGQRGTWITPDMERAYVRLHEEGYAHSVEVWAGEELAGGLYGLALGRCFFGESMFARVSNASKAGFIRLVEWLVQQGFTLIDSQVRTAHLASLGAEEIPRARYLRLLGEALEGPTLRGAWRAPGQAEGRAVPPAGA